MTASHARPAALIRAAARATSGWLLTQRLNGLIYRQLRRSGHPNLPETRRHLRAAVQNRLTSGAAHSPPAMAALRREAAAAAHHAHQARQARTLTRAFPWARRLSQADLADFAAELTSALPDAADPGNDAAARHVVAGWKATARTKAGPH